MKSNIFSHLVGELVRREANDWPPICNTILYQPERPISDHAEFADDVNESTPE